MGGFLRLHYPRLPFLPHLVRDVGQLEIIRSWDPQVVIAHCANQKFTDAILDLGIPVINTSGGLNPDMKLPTVTLDQEAVGRIAGSYLRERGCPSSYLLGATDSYITRDRWRGLQQSDPSGKHPVELVDLHSMHIPDKISARRSQGRTDTFEKWYLELGHATGILGDDISLVRICDYALRYRGTPINHLALLSTHDFQAACLPRLSAVRAPEKKWAVTAVEAALELVQGTDQSQLRTLIPPIGVEERESTSTINTGDRYLTLALEVIQNRVDQRTTVADVADEVGLVRRALELRFKKHLGSTVLEEIHRVHANRAMVLLRDTDFGIDDIASKSGFTDREHLRRVFRKRGLPPPATLRQDSRKQRGGL